MSKPAGGQKMISADCVAVLLMALGNTSITRSQLEMMSALDGTRTADSFQHQFRSIIAKAKELKKRVEDGEYFEPVVPPSRRSVTSTPATPKKPKRKADSETPSKKAKLTSHAGAKRKAYSMEAEEDDADHDDVGRYANNDFFPEFIKKEEMVEQEHLI